MDRLDFVMLSIIKQIYLVVVLFEYIFKFKLDFVMLSITKQIHLVVLFEYSESDFCCYQQFLNC